MEALNTLKCAQQKHIMQCLKHYYVRCHSLVPAVLHNPSELDCVR